MYYARCWGYRFRPRWEAEPWEAEPSEELLLTVQHSSDQRGICAQFSFVSDPMITMENVQSAHG